MEDGEINQAVLDKLTKVCLCKGISRAVMKKAIAGGADTVAKVQKTTGAGRLAQVTGGVVRRKLKSC